jgi:nucleoside-diphosphate-sugar epimerase
MIFILGGKGFLGSALIRYCQGQKWDYAAIDQEEYSAFDGASCDLLINANGNSRKFLASQNPVDDFDLNVRSVRRTLEDFRFGAYVYFSSADVYPDSGSPMATREDQFIDPACQSPYGFHKYLSEQCVRHKAAEWLILRLSGFVGPGLRKNPIHDILSDHPLWVSPDSEFQYLHTRDLARIVFELALDRGIRREVLNVGARGVISTQEAARLAGKHLNVREGSPRVRCELALEKLGRHCAIPQTVETIRDFVRSSPAIL